MDTVRPESLIPLPPAVFHILMALADLVRLARASGFVPRRPATD